MWKKRKSWLLVKDIDVLYVENQLERQSNIWKKWNRSSGVARICCEEGQRWKLCHGTLTANFRAGCSSCLMTNSFVTDAVLIKRAVSCWHLHQLISRTAQYLDSWLSGLLQSELKWNYWKSRAGEGGTCPSAP